MNRNLILKWLIYIVGAVCLYSFIAIRFLPLFNGTLKEPVVENYWDKTKYGELFYFSMILNFREKGLPPAQPKFQYSKKQATVKDAEILTFGDSFFDCSRHKQIPERIADDFHKNVNFVFNDFPLDYIEKNNYHDTIPKLVLFERVERYIPITFQKEHVWHNQKSEELSKVGKVYDYILDKIFYESSEKLYDAMLKRSYLTTSVYSLIATIKFKLFHYISNLTPVYKINGDNSWVFYYDQVNDKRTSFYYNFSQVQIDSICDNMADLSLKLKKSYHMDLVYLPLPARYTLYHTVLNNDTYNDFLPRLYKGLDARGVKYVNVYEDLINRRDTIFYRTDEHWKQEGLDITYKKTIEYLKSDSSLRTYLSNNRNLAN
jgi:hypothetical protein